MQVGGDPKYLKMIAGLKHYAAYSVEDDRPTFIPNVTDFDLWDSYLPHFKMGFQVNGGNAQAVMTSYSDINGIPSCDNDLVTNITNTILREAWNRSDVIVGTNCEAINDSLYYQQYASDVTDAAVKAIDGGTDLDLDDDYFTPLSQCGNGGLVVALEKGLIRESRVDESLKRILTARFKVGLFDRLDSSPIPTFPFQ
jgi:beta-glucosidase